MASGTINKFNEIKALTKTVTLPANEGHVSVTADIPDGYKFLCWVDCYSSGWVGFVYNAGGTSNPGTIWVTSASTSDRSVNTTYLVCK